MIRLLPGISICLKILVGYYGDFCQSEKKGPHTKEGTIVTSINGYTTKALTDTLFNYITTDGYSMNGKYQSLSTGFAFANLYKNVIGLTDSFDIHYIDSLGFESQTYVKPYDFRADTMNKKTLSHGPPAKGSGKKKEKPTFYLSSVNLQLDTVMKTGFMTVTTFDRSNHLRKFFKNSFRVLQENHIKNLIIDVRSNGGGDAGLSTFLTRYSADHKFKLADSLYTIKPPPNTENIFKMVLVRTTGFCGDQKGQGWQITFQIF